MACFNPLSASRMPDGSIAIGSRSTAVGFLQLPCGQCMGCRIERSRQWAVRIMHESKLHEHNCFITLTYAPDKLPQYGSLDYTHFQLFMKRLRKHFSGTLIRFFACGEYGERLQRPHFHACLFGIDFSDKEVIRNGKNPLYFSRTLSDLWGYGFVSIGSLTFASAQYVAAYCTKKVTGDAALNHYQRVSLETGEIYSVEPEFVRMSLKPGIGAGWFNKFHSDVFPHDRVVINGKVASPPRYYYKLFKRSGSVWFDKVVAQRALVKREQLFNPDNSWERLQARNVYTKAVYQSFSRNGVK